MNNSAEMMVQVAEIQSKIAALESKFSTMRDAYDNRLENYGCTDSCWHADLDWNLACHDYENLRWLLGET